MTATHTPLSELTASFSAYNADALPVEQAQEIMDRFLQPVTEVETVSLKDALGRVLAEDVISPIYVPPHDNAAMDGYAFSSRHLDLSAPQQLMIIGSAYAGHTYDGSVPAGKCVEIMTGAVMPPECDTVVPQEAVTLLDAHTVFMPENTILAGENRRKKGEDLAENQIALAAGTLLSPAHLGLLASLGIGNLLVKKALKVAFFSTGDELRSIGQKLDEGSIYDSNRYTLCGMLQRLGCDLLDMGVVPDNPVLLEEAFARACAQADIIISSGGVSVGVADHVKKVMAKMGDVAFWTIRMRPGRPMTFGKISAGEHSALLFGLPGNPVAVMVTFYFLVREALLRAMGADPVPLHSFEVPCMHPIAKRIGRVEYQRGVLCHNEQGQLMVQTTGTQGSGILRSMTEANCMIVLEEDRSEVQAGEKVRVIPFEGLV